MGLKTLFNKIKARVIHPKERFEKVNDTTLGHYTLKTPFISCIDLRESYDFAAMELLAVSIVYGVVTSTTTPFSEIDPKIVAAMRDKLVALGGHPPESPQTAAKNAPKPR